VVKLCEVPESAIELLVGLFEEYMAGESNTKASKPIFMGDILLSYSSYEYVTTSEYVLPS